MLPDYRGGVSFARGFGTRLDSSRSGPFLETNADAAYISRFDDDVIGYIQNRAGVTVPVGGVRVQLYWNGNFSADTKREYWGNQAETGPGLRIWWTRSVFLHVNAVRGAYLRNQGNPYGPNFYDLRIGFWYAFSY
jgi:hypothetical protein